MILTADVMKVATAALDAQTALRGKAWPHRGPDVPDAYPYVVVKVRPQAAETFSGSRYVQKFMVQAAAYIPLGPAAEGDPTREDAMKALAAALTTSTAAVVTTLRNAGERVLHAIPSTADERFDPRLREGKDVLVAEVTAELLCQGDRSVA